MDRRIPSLDGARALSILLVIASHLTASMPPLPIIWRVDYGNLGVRVFFVISGFLITSLLLQEFQKTGRINLADFYLRRAFRILPAYYIYVGVVAILIPTGLVLAQYSDLAPTLLYYSNYRHIHWTLGQSWSLSVEEQFYLLWPTAILALGLRRAKYACLAVMLTAPLVRAIYWELHVGPTYIQNAFETVSDALATGCLLTLFRDRLWANAVYRRAVESGWIMMLFAGAVLFIAAQPSAIVHDVIGLPLLNIGIVTLLDRCMRFPKIAAGRLLNFKPIAWIGTISYSLYLWQQLFTQDNFHLPAAVRVACMFAAAAISYYWVEKPFLAFRRKVQARQTVPLSQPA